MSGLVSKNSPSAIAMRYDDGVVRFSNLQTHGLFSSFTWTVAAPTRIGDM
jgi:hypothetical protein